MVPLLYDAAILLLWDLSGIVTALYWAYVSIYHLADHLWIHIGVLVGYLLYVIIRPRRARPTQPILHTRHTATVHTTADERGHLPLLVRCQDNDECLRSGCRNCLLPPIEVSCELLVRDWDVLTWRSGCRLRVAFYRS